MLQHVCTNALYRPYIIILAEGTIALSVTLSLLNWRLRSPCRARLQIKKNVWLGGWVDWLVGWLFFGLFLSFLFCFGLVCLVLVWCGLLNLFCWLVGMVGCWVFWFSGGLVTCWLFGCLLVRLFDWLFGWFALFCPALFCFCFFAAWSAAWRKACAENFCWTKPLLKLIFGREWDIQPPLGQTLWYNIDCCKTAIFLSHLCHFSIITIFPSGWKVGLLVFFEVKWWAPGGPLVFFQVKWWAPGGLLVFFQVKWWAPGGPLEFLCFSK